MPRKVVLGPDILVAALFDARARQIVNRWRDGEIMPVVTRELLVAYLRALARAGLSPDLLQKWSLWLTTPGKVFFLEQSGNGAAASAAEICRELALAHGAELITCRAGA